MLKNRIFGLILMFLPLVCVAKTFVVCVGIATYEDSNVNNLEKSEKDAIAMANFYKKGTENVIIITGKYAIKSQIIKSLNDQFARAGTDDKIVFYFSGHGYPGGFCPYEMRRLEDGLSYEEVISIMASSRAKDKIIFADACNSGAIRNNKRSSKPNPGNIMMFLSSRGNEFSIEASMLSNGYFTNYLLHGLKGKADVNGDRTITAKELYDYVSAGVIRLSKEKQHPVMWGNFPDDMPIVIYNKK